MSRQAPSSHSIWTHLWFHPRTAIRDLLDTRLKDARIYWLAIIYGILGGLSFLGALWMRYPHRTEWHHPLYITSTIIGGAIFGIIQLYFFSWLYMAIGRWFKGKSSFQEMKLAFGWAQYPFCIAALLNVIATLLFHHPIWQGVILVLHFIILVWSIVIGIAVVAEAHRFSAGRSIGTLIVSFILLIVAILIIIFIIALLVSLFTPNLSSGKGS